MDICYDSKVGHIASSLSAVEIIYGLYGFYEGNDNKFDFILSKGHGAPCLYSVLFKFNIISSDKLKSFCKYGSDLIAHVSVGVPGILVSSGALGMGLSVGSGFCMANEINKNNKKVYVLIGDGEMNEGAVWESFLYAKSSKLEKLVCLVDNNKLQASNYSDKIINTNLAFKAIKAMGWKTFYVDGHDLKKVNDVYKKIHKISGPIVVVFDTTKGKGVSFIENNILWHHKSLTFDEYTKAKSEIVYEK